MDDGRDLTVNVDRDGRVCVLRVAGELDLLGVGDFLSRTAHAVNATARGGHQAEWFVLELAGLTFLDCAGAQALASVIDAVPSQCPVIVRSLSPAARRLLDLIGLDLEHRPGAAVPETSVDWASDLVRRSQAVRSSARQVMSQIGGTAESVAATEYRVAATMARLARQHPHQAARLEALSEQARSYAISIGHRADETLTRLGG